MSLELLVVQGLDGLDGILVVDKVDESESGCQLGFSGDDERQSLPLGFGLGVVLVLDGKSNRHGLSERRDEVLELLLLGVDINVLDEDVGVVGLLLFMLGLSLLLSDVVSDIDLFIVEQHTVDILDGSVGGFTGRVVNEAVRKLGIEQSENMRGLTRILARFQSRRFRPCMRGSHRKRQRCREGPAHQLLLLPAKNYPRS